MKHLLLIFFVPLIHAQDLRKVVVEPSYPKVCTSLSAELTAAGETLAPSDEAKLDTKRIQQAMDKCPAGQAVELKAKGERNAFLSGPLELRAGVTLLVSRGTVLFASRDPRVYDVEPGVCGTITERGRGCRPLISGNAVTGAGVMGEGVIDGRGGYPILGQKITWWDLAEQARKGGNQNNPRIMVLNRCDNFTLYKIQLKDSPNFHVSYSGGTGFTAWGVIVNSPERARNTDGIDPGNSTNVTITKCFINTGDDNVAIKAPKGAPTTHMTISDNHFYSGHGMSIGSNTDGGASAIWVRNLTIDGADNGLRIKSNETRGGPVTGVVYEDVCIRNTKHPILMDSNYTASVGKEKGMIPSFTGIVLRNVHISGGGKINLDGADAGHRLGIQFDGVSLDAATAKSLHAVHAQIKLGPGPTNLKASGKDVQVSGEAGTPSSGACEARFVPFPVAVSQKTKK